jgi:UPF0755 protein
VLPMAAAGLTIFALLVAGYAVSRTPRDVLGGTIVSREAGPAATGQVAYTLPPNRTAAQIGDDLEALGVIRSGEQLRMLVALMGLESKLSAGDYTLTRGSSALSVIEAITVKVSSPTIRVTFPEGLRIEEMAEIAASAGFGTAEEFMAAVASAKLPADLEGVIPIGESLQGFLFPDTYILPEGSTPAQLVELMLKTFVRRFSPELRAAANAQGLDVYQAVTLASIIEREAALDEERPLMAAVFYNRLAVADRLGADPTVQFAVALDPESVAKFGWWKKELTLEDLDNDSKYNTRKFAGLPPGPIANPGLASLQAVANPAQSKAYYFVADARKGDGSHVFAETQAEHDRNIATVGSPP